ncbi:TPA: chorismate synthase [Candidatus Micrarchaeota archaeon]|nr:chorismate synthase [Candidatus Micrarchaeota archaeon]
MNTFGRLFRVSVIGESHGACVGAVIDGCPAGISLSAEDLLADIARRKSGATGTTPRTEEDKPKIVSGVFNGKTTGAPILIEFENRDTDSTTYERIKNTPRPGHADFVAHAKFGRFNDYRGGGHFSGRLTLGLVAAGAIAKKMVAPVRVEANLTEAGGSKDENNIKKSIESAMQDNDSVGGIIECRASGIPIGLGEPFFDSVESLISHTIFSIPAVKGIEFGAGFACARMRGSECNDEIIDTESGKTKSNNSGGINGGITNGNELVFRVAVKPTSSIAKEQQTVDLRTGKPAELSIQGRHDACIALRAPVVIEAATAIVLADLMLLEQKIKRVSKV